MSHTKYNEGSWTARHRKEQGEFEKQKYKKNHTSRSKKNDIIETAFIISVCSGTSYTNTEENGFKPGISNNFRINNKTSAVLFTMVALGCLAQGASADIRVGPSTGSLVNPNGMMPCPPVQISADKVEIPIVKECVVGIESIKYTEDIGRDIQLFQLTDSKSNESCTRMVFYLKENGQVASFGVMPGYEKSCAVETKGDKLLLRFPEKPTPTSCRVYVPKKFINSFMAATTQEERKKLFFSSNTTPPGMKPAQCAEFLTNALKDAKDQPFAILPTNDLTNGKPCSVVIGEDGKLKGAGFIANANVEGNLVRTEVGCTVADGYFYTISNPTDLDKEEENRNLEKSKTERIEVKNDFASKVLITDRTTKGKGQNFITK